MPNNLIKTLGTVSDTDLVIGATSQAPVLASEATFDFAKEVSERTESMDLKEATQVWVNLLEKWLNDLDEDQQRELSNNPILLLDWFNASEFETLVAYGYVLDPSESFEDNIAAIFTNLIELCEGDYDNQFLRDFIISLSNRYESDGDNSLLFSLYAKFLEVSRNMDHMGGTYSIEIETIDTSNRLLLDEALNNSDGYTATTIRTILEHDADLMEQLVDYIRESKEIEAEPGKSDKVTSFASMNSMDIAVGRYIGQEEVEDARRLIADERFGANSKVRALLEGETTEQDNVTEEFDDSDDDLI